MKPILCLALVLAACGPRVDGPLVVTNLTPSRGSARGGQAVTLEGTGFDKTATVRIGGAAARVQNATDTKLSLLMPASPAWRPSR